MKILVCPLDWGLGHATRCIPLIRALVENGHQVRIGAAEGGKRLLEAEFPGLDIFDFPGYRVRYSRSPAFFLPVMLAQLPRVLMGMFSETRRLRRILAEQPCDLVISDGRYGVIHAGIPCIFVTHQIFIRVPGKFPGAGLVERLVLALNLRMLRRFDRVWVPDFPGGRTLSGELSHKDGALDNLEFIQPLSRFNQGGIGEARSGDESPRVDVLAMVSGPEPQRGLFEAALREQLKAMGGTRVLVRGLPESKAAVRNSLGLAKIHPEALNEFAHLPGAVLAHLFRSSGMIVARSGYTTVMELAGTRARAVVLVPTPGQSEQEYLADHLEASGTVVKMEQASLDLGLAREKLGGRTGFPGWTDEALPLTSHEFNLAAFLAGHPLFRASVSPPDAADHGSRDPSGSIVPSGPIDMLKAPEP